LYTPHSREIIASSKVRSWVVLQAEEADEFIFQINGVNQAICVIVGNTAVGAPMSLIDRIYTGQGNYKTQRWTFEPVDADGTDLQDPNTLKFPSLLGPGTNDGGNQGDGSASATEASANAYVGTLKDNGAAFKNKTVTNITNVFAATTAISIKNGAISMEAIGGFPQKWEVIPSSVPGEYYFSDTAQGLILGHPMSIKPGNTPVLVSDPEDNRWRILSETGTGSDALIVHPLAGLALFVDSQNNGAPITLQYASDDNKFKWRFNGVN